MFAHKVHTQPIELVISPINSYELNNYNSINSQIKKLYYPLNNQFHYFSVRQDLCFPNKKLLMYDCGKLNTLVQLLKKLKDRGDKCLIFT